MRNLYLITCLVTVVSIVTADAQSFYAIRRDRDLVFTVGANSSTYYGDLKDDSDVLDVKPSLSLGLKFNVSSKIGIRGEFSWLSLSGKDASAKNELTRQRNLSFTSSNYEVSATGLYYFFPHKGKFYQRPQFNIYGFAGFGLLFFNPKAELDGKKYPLQPLKTEGVAYGKSTLIIPFGIGVKTKITPFFDLGLELGWRKSFSDYIDDVSGRYVDPASFTNPIARQLADRRPEIGLEPAKAGRIRGNASNDDGYMLLSAKLEFYLPYQLNKNKKMYSYKRRPSHR